MSKHKMKNSWCADIMNPFEFMCRNHLTSNIYEKVHGENITFYVTNSKDKRRYRASRHGIQLQEDKANDQVVYFHDMRGVSCDL